MKDPALGSGMYFGKAAAHGIVGESFNQARGGNFGAGFASAAISSGMEGVSTGYLETNVMMHATIGGTTSVIMGGKFKNGAITSAFVYLYNECGHGCEEESLFAQMGRAKNNSPVWPTDHQKVTSGYSLDRVDPVTGKTSRPHTAIDIKNPHGDPVYTILDGEVVAVDSSTGAGNYIKVDHGNGLETSYSHTSNTVNVGDTVTRGQIIGHSDSSGRIHGPHLHFVTRQNGTRVNPCTVVTCP